MDELDKKLDDSFLYKVADLVERDKLDEAAAYIKQAYGDAGWFRPADAEFVQQIINHRAQQKIDKAIHGVSVVEVEAEKLSGPEWLEKFYYAVLPEGGSYDEDYTIKMDTVICAAKKASGVE